MPGLNSRRNKSVGDSSVDYSALRKNIKNVNPVVERTLRNAVRKDPGTSGNSLDVATPDTRKLENLSHVISNNINAITDLREITPYIDKAELIWSTLLLYPNGPQKKILSFDTPYSPIKNTQLHTELLSIWDNYFTSDYKIETELKKIVNDVLWNTGSYCVLNVSRPNLDYLINGSQMSITGNEALRTELSKEFNLETKKLKNKGLFVRNPNRVKTNDVTGIESLFGISQPVEEEEFNIFEGIEAKGEDSLDKLLNFTITDNPSALYLRKVKENHDRFRANQITGAESYGNLISRVAPSLTPDQSKKKGAKKAKENNTAKTKHLSLEQLEGLQQEIFIERDPVAQSIQFVKNNDELTDGMYGQGLRYHVPSEAAIRVHRNGGVEDSVDYIFLIDPDDGTFLKSTKDFQFYQDSKKTGSNNSGNIDSKSQQGSTNHLITSLKKVQQGSDCDFDMTEFANLAEDLIIKRFIGSVIKGDSDNISITLDEETNKIFLQRMFRSQGIRCLYVPGECVTYAALKYNRLGLGQSLVHNAKMHISRLAALDLADALANMEAAQPHTLMTIGIEDEDVSPNSTIAAAREAYFKANPRLHSILASSQLSIPMVVDALMQQSLTIKIDKGDNPHIAAPNIDLEQRSKENFKTVDDNSRQEILNRIANYFFLPIGWLDVSDDTNNFQIEALTEHQMILNQTLNWQEIFSIHFSDMMRKHARVNELLLNRLITAIHSAKTLWKSDDGTVFPKESSEKDIVEHILVDFLNGVSCSLPAPTSGENASKLKDNLEAVDALVNSWIEMSGYSGLLSKMVEELGLDEAEYGTDVIEELIKANFKTEAYRRYNIPMPFDDIVGDGKQGGIYSLINSIIAQRGNLKEFLNEFMKEAFKQDKKTMKDKEKLKKLFEKLHEGEEEEEEEFTDNSTNDTSELSYDDLSDDTVSTDFENEEEVDLDQTDEEEELEKEEVTDPDLEEEETDSGSEEEEENK